MPEETEVRFEVALSQLEQIVASLERGEPDLAAALAKYETGVKLLTRCYGLLERAERSVALLTGVDAQGNPVTAPFDATATIEMEKVMLSTAGTNSSNEQPQASPEPVSRPSRSRRAKPAAEPDAEPGPDRFDPPF
ncbi:MAG: exodeoxyribonuclease VII small subunit [Isosphaeraceae bacterium]